MRLHQVLLGTAFVAATVLTVPLTASAADGIYVPLLSYRTGPFAGSGTPAPEADSVRFDRYCETAARQDHTVCEASDPATLG